MENQPEILFYTADDGKTKLQVRLDEDTVWLNQKQIPELFDKSRVTITDHIGNVFAEDELAENSVCRNFRHTIQYGAIQGKTQDNTVKYYNLDVIINYHLKRVFYDSELEEASVIRNFRMTAADGKSYDTKHYNLAAIIAVGYKVNSERAVQFRKWATGIIESFTIKESTDIN